MKNNVGVDEGTDVLSPKQQLSREAKPRVLFTDAWFLVKAKANPAGTSLGRHEMAVYIYASGSKVQDCVRCVTRYRY